jgi:hypothetical protein
VFATPGCLLQIKTGFLEGTLYERGRRDFSLSSPPKKYVIDRKSVERARDRRGRSNTASTGEQ